MIWRGFPLEMDFSDEQEAAIRERFAERGFPVPINPCRDCFDVTVALLDRVPEGASKDVRDAGVREVIYEVWQRGSIPIWTGQAIIPGRAH